MAETYARLVAADFQRFWQMAENAVFNDWTYVYCKDALRCRKLADVIAYGIQLEDVAELVPAALQEAALENAEQAVVLRQRLIEKGPVRTEKHRRL